MDFCVVHMKVKVVGWLVDKNKLVSFSLSTETKKIIL